jgi:hypothetical protein
MIQQFLSSVDADRALRTFRELAHHDMRRLALTGGFATEVYRLRYGCRPSVRCLNDIDFIAESFESIPESLADGFLFRHIHPLDPPGRTMLQAVFEETAVRVDVFRAYDATMSRTCNLDLPTGTIQLISLEDLVARAARLALDLAEGVPTPSKHATDFLRLAELIHPEDVEAAWCDHRKPEHPGSFRETNRLLLGLIPACEDLLITPEYSEDTEKVCPRCRTTTAFRVADAKLIQSILGYC